MRMSFSCLHKKKRFPMYFQNTYLVKAQVGDLANPQLQGK